MMPTSRPISAAVAAFLIAFALPTEAQRPSDQPVRVRFSAVVGDVPLACGVRYDDIGLTKSSVSLADLAFYVSRLRVVKADGTEQAVSLTQDGPWQTDDVALLDFENGTADCANGTEETRTVVEGRVPAGAYVGLRFDLGLPFEKNHQDPTLQPSPLNLSRMFWSWNAGYKFMRLEIESTKQPEGWMLHLGSTGCLPGGSPRTSPVSCARPNRVTVDLPSFDVVSDVVEFDLKALLAESNVDSNTAQTAIGCMSGPNDPECSPLLKQFGLLAADGVALSPQAVFRARRSTSVAP